MTWFNRLLWWKVRGGETDGASVQPKPIGDATPGLSAEGYASALHQVLSQHNTHALDQMTALVQHLPPRATELHFGVHPDQDGTGTFTVMAHVIGPDQYVLNKAVAAYRVIFDVKMTATGLTPAVPMMDNFSLPYEVNDVIVDTVADWLAARVTDLPQKPAVKMTVFGDEGYGTTAPRNLG